MLPFLLAAAGVALLLLSTWLRLGRTDGARSWVGGRQFERTVLVTLPLAAVVLLCCAVLSSGHDGPAATGAAALAGLALVLFLLFVPVGLPMPRWSLPEWYVVRTAARRAASGARRGAPRTSRRGSS